MKVYNNMESIHHFVHNVREFGLIVKLKEMQTYGNYFLLAKTFVILDNVND